MRSYSSEAGRPGIEMAADMICWQVALAHLEGTLQRYTEAFADHGVHSQHSSLQ